MRRDEDRGNGPRKRFRERVRCRKERWLIDPVSGRNAKRGPGKQGLENKFGSSANKESTRVKRTLNRDHLTVKGQADSSLFTPMKTGRIRLTGQPGFRFKNRPNRIRKDTNLGFWFSDRRVGSDSEQL